MSLRFFSAALVTCGLALGQNLVVNGDFEQPENVGWTLTSEGAGVPTVQRDVSYHPDPDYEIMVEEYDGAGWVNLGQVIEVHGTWAEISFWAKFELGGSTSTCWPVACVNLSYLDEAGAVLGETRFYYHDDYCAWVPAETLHLVNVTNPDWTQYHVDVEEELSSNLPGVDPAAVRRIGINLYNYTSSG